MNFSSMTAPINPCGSSAEDLSTHRLNITNTIFAFNIVNLAYKYNALILEVAQVGTQHVHGRTLYRKKYTSNINNLIIYYPYCRSMFNLCGEAEMGLATEILQYEIEVERKVITPIQTLLEVTTNKYIFHVVP